MTVVVYWIPLGAGGHVVRRCGAVFEAIASRRQRRPRQQLVHAALGVELGDTNWVIEQTPVPRGDQSLRGVIASGPVGMRWLGRFRIFRYEIRCWPGGRIPDIDWAIGDPLVVSDLPEGATRAVDAVARVPTPTWGRDELGFGEMWNSNSVVAWVLTASGFSVESTAPPFGYRAPGWAAGIRAATEIDGAP